MHPLKLPALPNLLVSLLAVAGMGCQGSSNDKPADGTGPAKARYGLTAEQAAAVLVQVGDTKITVGQFADELAEQSPYLRARYNSPERRKEYLDSLVRFELLAQASKEKGYFTNPDVERASKQAMIQQFIRHEFEEKFKLSDITNDDIRKHYETHLSEFKKPEQVRISHIVTKNKSAAQRILGQVLTAPGDDALWKRLAEQHTEDVASKDSFGDIGFHSKPQDRGNDPAPPVPDAAIDAAFALQNPGDVAKALIEGPNGFHIIRLTAKRPALVRSLEEARRSIQDKLRRERRDAALDALVTELRRKADVKEDPSLLASVKVEAPAPPSGKVGAAKTKN